MTKVTVIGGGTGTYVVLSGLRNYNLDLGVVVTMMDSGGSTGRLRDQLEVLPPGDLRQCLVALSDAPILWRKLFLYRFENGDLKGHNFGNIFLSALEKVSGDYQEVIKTVGHVLKTKGAVIPVTFQKTNLCVEYENGKILKGEGEIDKNYKEKSRVKRAFLEPEVSANPEALKRIEESDYIIAGPGDLYSSIVPVLITGKMKEVIKKSRAKIIYNLNLMTKCGQTANYKASDHLNDLTNYFGRALDTVVINKQVVPDNVKKWYKSQEEKVVANDLTEANYQGQVITEDLLNHDLFIKSSNDQFVDPKVRSILRHDPNKLAQVIQSVIEKTKSIDINSRSEQLVSIVNQVKS